MSSEQNVRQPHDVFFKETFGRPDVAGDFLQNYAPASVVSLLRLDALEAQPGTFVDSDLQEHFSDLLYRAPLLDGGAAFVYILFEHKSYPDKLAAFQLLRYMVRVWERVLRDEPESSLPPILPILLYHGRTAWQFDATFDALFAGPEEMRVHWPSFAFQVTDLSRYSDAELRGKVLLLAALLTMKHIFDRRLPQVLPRILRMVRDWARQETGLEYLHTFLRYVGSAGTHVSRAELRRIVDSVLVQEGNAAMATAAQEWIQEGKELGRQEGKELGRQEGKELGRQEGAQVVRKGILSILRLRFTLSDTELEPYTQRLAQITDLQTLDALHQYALTEFAPGDFLRRLDSVTP